MCGKPYFYLTFHHLNVGSHDNFNVFELNEVVLKQMVSSAINLML